MGEHKNWFARNKGFVFGFAVAVAILNIVIFVLMPQQTPIRIDETVTEYVCGDESFAAEHTIQLTGTLTRSMLAKPLFLGTLRISGVDALAEPVTLRLERQDGRWTGNFNDAYGQPLVWQQYGVLSMTRTRTSASFSSGSRRTRRSSTSSRPARHPARQR